VALCAATGCVFDASGLSTPDIGKQAPDIAFLDLLGDVSRDNLMADHSVPDAPIQDTQPDQSPDAMGCPKVCAKCVSGTCHMDCSNGCVCPAGMPCSIVCSGSGKCNKKIDCGQATSCTISCTNGACTDQIICTSAQCNITCDKDACLKEITCGPGRCVIKCSNDSCLGGPSINCGNSCACQAGCLSSSCPASVACPALCGVVFGKGCVIGPNPLCNKCP
jgi:hypothetical protein